MPSAVIQAMRYEPTERQLMIAFRDVSGVYLYEGVGPAEWGAFRDAESKGTYLNSVFKPRHHPYRHFLPTLALRSRSQAANMAGEEWGEVGVLPDNPFRVAQQALEARPRPKSVKRDHSQFELLPGFRNAA